MKKFYILLLTACVALTATAQSLSAEQFLRLQRKAAKTTKAETRAGGTPLTFPTIDYWVGQGTDSAALVIAWNNGLRGDTIAWGYRFNATDNITGAQMLEAIVKADPALYARVSSSQYGLYIEGLGYDRNGDVSTSVASNNTTLQSPDGWNLFPTSGYTTNTDPTDHFRGGYDATSGKYFAYLVGKAGSGLASSPVGASSRMLENGAVDVYSYQGWGDTFFLSTHNPAYPQPALFTKGVYLVNEDWFGHNSGSVNFYNTETSQLFHNIHRTPTDANTLGVTTQHGTLHAGRLYLMSKQDKGSSVTEGSRLAIFNAATMQLIHKVDAFPNGGDGRAIAVVNDTLAYITTTSGLYTLHLHSLAITPSNIVPNTELGLIQRVGEHILIQDITNDAIHFIYAPNQVVVKTVAGHNFAVSKDGRIWVLETHSKLQAYDATSLAKGQSISLPISTVRDFAWTAGSFFAGNTANTLFYVGAGSGFPAPTPLYRIKLDEATPTPTLFSDPATIILNTDKIYGSAVRLRPEDDNIFMVTFKGWGDTDYDLIQLNAEGRVVRTVGLPPHYWFPALPLFTDSQAPVVASIANQEIALTAPTLTLPLSATDADSYEAHMLFTATSAKPDVATATVAGQTLTLTGLTAGTSQITVVASNGGYKGYTAFMLNVTEVPTAIASATVKGQLNVAHGQITVNDLAGETLRVYTISGQQVLQTAVTSQHFTTALPEASGLYIIKVGALTLKVQR